MVQLTPQAIEEFKEIYKKKTGEELNDTDATESAQNLMNLVEIIYDVAKEDYLRKQRLKKEPKGFHLESNKFYTCRICGETKNGGDLWWDKYGTKCMDCQANLENKTFPKRLLKGKIPSDNWLISWQFKDKFNIHSSTIRKLVREDKLKSIQLKNSEGLIYHEIFPIKDNLEFLNNLLIKQT